MKKFWRRKSDFKSDLLKYIERQQASVQTEIYNLGNDNKFDECVYGLKCRSLELGYLKHVIKTEDFHFNQPKSKCLDPDPTEQPNEVAADPKKGT